MGLSSLNCMGVALLRNFKNGHIIFALSSLFLYYVYHSVTLIALTNLYKKALLLCVLFKFDHYDQFYAPDFEKLEGHIDFGLCVHGWIGACCNFKP